MLATEHPALRSDHSSAKRHLQSNKQKTAGSSPRPLTVIFIDHSYGVGFRQSTPPGNVRVRKAP